MFTAEDQRLKAAIWLGLVRIFHPGIRKTALYA